MTTVEVSEQFVVLRLEDYDFDALPPFIVGVSGPQGSGKSYLTLRLADRLAKRFPDRNVVYFSIDDFYLTHEDQQHLSSTHSDNPLLQGRGLPGTHDFKLLGRVMGEISSRGSSPVEIPRYDKLQFGGEGDRCPRLQWVSVELPVHIVVCEGWLNGFMPLSDEDEVRRRYRSLCFFNTNSHLTFPHILDMDRRLEEYARVLFRSFSCFVFLETRDLNYVYKWRLEQEHALIAECGRGMTDGEVFQFVDRYMPAYEIYYRGTGQTGCVASGGNLQIELGPQREVLGERVY